MADILHNIISIRNELTKVSIKSFGFVGYSNSASSVLIEVLKQVPSSYLRECYYVSSNIDVDFDDVNIEEEICIKINLGELSNFYNSLSEFTNANKTKLNHSAFYIHDLNYYEGESVKNEVIENYKANILVIAFLKNISDYSKNIAQELVDITDYTDPTFTL